MCSRSKVSTALSMLLVIVLAVCTAAHAGEDQDRKLGDGSSLRARLEWFQDMKFGLIVHFGIYSQWGCIESWPLVEADKWARPDDLRAWIERGKDMERFKADYRNLNRTFQPVNFDPRAWAETRRLPA